MSQKKFLCYTDTHLDFAWPWERRSFAQTLIKETPEGIFLTGDISNGKHLYRHLSSIADKVKCPIYFVLGNHDYWNSSFQKTHEVIRELVAKYPNLTWMTEAGIVELSQDSALIGTEGWYDGTYGKPDFIHFMWDWFHIEELRETPLKNRLDFYRELASFAAKYIESALAEAFKNYRTVYILTHFPPWIEATYDVGSFFEKVWSPYNVSARMGESIERVMTDYPDNNVVVLAGHTHSKKFVQISHNIEVRINGAKYIGKPDNSEYVLI